MLLWIYTNLMLNFPDKGQQDVKVNQENFDIPKRREIAMNILRIQNYQKYRDARFDFAYLGEREILSIK